MVSFEAIRTFAVETAAFPPELAWSAPLLVDSFTTAASLVILWRYLRGDGWRDPWYAWMLVACATAVSVALNVAHAPERLSAQLFAALPPVALLGALELLMSVARTGLPHTPAAYQLRPSQPLTPLASRSSARPAATATVLQPRSRPPCLRTAPTQSSTARPHRMRGPACGRWSPVSAPAARP